MADLPLIMTAAGPVPTPPATIQQQLLAQVEATSPGYTARLPGLLIEDFSSTAVASLALADAARVETVNSLTPYGSNAFILSQQGQMTGISQAGETNTTVGIVFTGTPNFVISQGFFVSDGANQYYALDGGIVGSTGVSPTLAFAAANSGSWAVPAGTVTAIETSIPSTITLSCTNPSNGSPGNSAQTETSYRAQVLQAWSAAGQGMPSYIKALIGQVSGVIPRLIAVQQQLTGGWKIIVGGNYDPAQVAYAIYRGCLDISALVPSSIPTRNNLVPVIDYPDVYNVAFVSSPQQLVTASVTWNTTATNFVNTAAIAQLAAPVLAAYVNQIPVGQPMNLFDMQDTFRNAVSTVLAPALLTRVVFAVSINGIGVAPVSGTGVIAGDSESYLWADPTGVGFTITQG